MAPGAQKGASDHRETFLIAARETAMNILPQPLPVSAEWIPAPRRLVVVDGVRTPFCKVGTSLAGVSAAELGKCAVQGLIARTGLDPSTVDEVIFGCVGQPADAANIARVIALRAGLPHGTVAMTVQRNCASGLEALTTAAAKMAAGLGEVFIVGGVESMSQMPLLFPSSAGPKFSALAKARTLGQKLAALTRFRAGDFKARSGLSLGLTDPVVGLNMGQTAELLAREFKISRSEQDAFSLQSHQKAAAAKDRLKEEITPAFTSPEGKPITEDNGIRLDTSMEALAKLPLLFDREYGSVTAGNSSQVTDGAAALLVMTEQRSTALGLKPLGRLVSQACTGCDPARMGLGPVDAMQKASAAARWKIGEAHLVEINEAFAAQVLAVRRSLPVAIHEERLNVNGGAIALGHPVGASGARLSLTALLELRRRGGGRAIVSLCIGGGQGLAACFES